MQLLEQKVNLAAQLKKLKHRLTAHIRSMAEMHRDIRDNGFVSNLFCFKLCFSADFKWREFGKNC